MKAKMVILILTLLVTQSFVLGQKVGRKKQLSLTETTFYIRNVASGKYIDIPGGPGRASTKNGCNVQLWDMDAGSDRKFRIRHAGGSYYYISPGHARMNLDVHGCFKGKLFCGTYKHKRGANVQLWSSGTSKPQQWKLEQVRTGQFRIVNRYSGKVLDAKGSDVHKNGCNVLQWDWNGGNNQLWELVDVVSGARYTR